MSAAGVAICWPCNGILAAGILLLSQKKALILVLACASIDFLCSHFVSRAGIVEALMIAQLDVVQAVIAAVLMRRFGGAALNPTRLRSLGRMTALAFLPATLITATLGSISGAEQYHYDFFSLWPQWMMGDFLGMLIGAPTALILSRYRYFDLGGSKSALVKMGVPASIVVLSGLIFWFRSPLPLHLLVFPVLIVAAFFISPPFLMTTILAVMGLAVAFTITGRGLVSSGHSANSTVIFLSLQIYLAGLVGSAMGLMAHLAERRKAEIRLQSALMVARTAEKKSRAADAAKTDFLANISHEIRTPLNGVIGLVSALSRTPMSVSQKEMVELIESSSATLERLVSDILDLSKIGDGELQIEMAELDLLPSLESVLELSRRKAHAKGLSFQVDLGESARGCFYGDSVRIRQVLDNLVSNAIKFTESGSISVQIDVQDSIVFSDPAKIRISVVDTGIGFSPAFGEELFKRFKQADVSITRRFGGSGLGLSICHALVKLMGGEIEASSQLGCGSAFRFTVPASRTISLEDYDLRVAQKRASDLDLTADAAGRALEPATLQILLGEDNPTNQQVVATILSGLGANIKIAANGREAVEAFRQAPFDFVLMDMQMPELDGLGAIGLIRALERDEPERGRTPIAILSANALAEHKIAAEKVGADLFITKPITADRLLDGVEVLMQIGERSSEIPGVS